MKALLNLLLAATIGLGLAGLSQLTERHTGAGFSLFALAAVSGYWASRVNDAL